MKNQNEKYDQFHYDLENDCRHEIINVLEKHNAQIYIAHDFHNDELGGCLGEPHVKVQITINVNKKEKHYIDFKLNDI